MFTICDFCFHGMSPELLQGKVVKFGHILHLSVRRLLNMLVLLG